MTEKQTNIDVSFDSVDQMSGVFGSFDENINIISAQTGTAIRATEHGICISGTHKAAQEAADIIEVLKKMYNKNENIGESTISYAMELVRDGHQEMVGEMMSDVVAITARGKQIKCKSYGQKEYIRAIKENTVVVCVGPAGTGKTYLAMAMAVVALKNKQVSRIILTRPAVEAGEKLGFLPGDMQNKVDPYLRPLYDALYDFMGAEAYARLSEKGAIEVAPLAYMRGRTLNDAFIILDEAQNCTMEQMKMFLTRFGENSKVVVTGDVTQIDLPKERSSGLKKVTGILKNIDHIGIVSLTNKDVVRHPLVKSIVKAFEKYENRRGSTIV
ncbi:phosphate starvation protein PhoH [Christensenellaceae bacterium]|nr:phosphate starvation protein PhoH [Christensenellaceae bacterium]BDF61205.1 phosphate starvation protein PhoH [Christensenellaceae bacterium]